MTRRRAEATLRDFFAPASLGDFLAALGRHSFDVPAGPGDARRKLFGDEPGRLCWRLMTATRPSSNLMG